MWGFFIKVSNKFYIVGFLLVFYADVDCVFVFWEGNLERGSEDYFLSEMGQGFFDYE